MFNDCNLRKTQSNYVKCEMICFNKKKIIFILAISICPPTPPSSDYFDDDDAEMASWFEKAKSGLINSKVKTNNFKLYYLLTIMLKN
jgi:hypothetical protein